MGNKNLDFFSPKGHVWILEHTDTLWNVKVPATSNGECEKEFKPLAYIVSMSSLAGISLLPYYLYIDTTHTTIFIPLKHTVPLACLEN